MTRETAAICKKYCGAVAVSWYRSPYTLKAISILLEAGVKTNIHYVLMKDSIKEAIDLLEGDKFPKGINAVVFLLHKPVGLGSDTQIIRKENPDLKMMPCSFDNQKQRWSVDLRSSTIQEAWFSKAFDDFRSHLKNACPECEHRSNCMGGCPICPEIVLCDAHERKV